MRVAVIGAGNVGKMVFHDLQNVNMVEEIILIGRNIQLVKAEVVDAKDAAVLKDRCGPKLSYGGYEAAAGADIIVYTAGSSVVKADRMEMLHDNCVITEQIFSEIKKVNRDAIIICVTNPNDVITMKIHQVMGQDPRRVIGSGTLLETARLVRYVSELLELSDRSVHMSVVGEHGASAVALFSSVRIMGLSLDEYLRSVTDESIHLNAVSLNEIIKKIGFQIHAGKGFTSTGVSGTVCRIVSAIGMDQREILPVSSVLQGEYGIKDVAVSVPSIIGRNGIEEIREVRMTKEEREEFLASAAKIRQVAEAEGILR